MVFIKIIFCSFRNSMFESHFVTYNIDRKTKQKKHSQYRFFLFRKKQLNMY